MLAEGSVFGNLEESLATETRLITEFAHVSAQSNPNTTNITAFPASQWWYEKDDTVQVGAENQTIWVLKNLYFGNIILFVSSGMSDATDRDMAYRLYDLLTIKMMGFQPYIGDGFTIFPLEPVDGLFTQLDNGMTAFTSYWKLQLKFGKDGAQ